jgi:steroid delta-isomerase-like uncharacterized protein
MAQEQFIRSLYDAVNRKDLEKFVSFFSDDAQFNDVSASHVYRGRTEIRGMAENWLKALPDMKLQISNIIGTGDVCCVEVTLVGTHNGPLTLPQGSIPASGKKVSVPACDVIRLRNGKVQSYNCYFAATVLLNQIGAMPTQLAA